MPEVSSDQSNIGNIPRSLGRAAVIGGGPAGLMAAEVLASAGASVDVYESMPTLGRKFLRAGLGGLNITHSESFEKFCSRYGDRQKHLQACLNDFHPDALRKWVHSLGIKTFVGTSGRVFPNEMKAAPLLRAWVHRLRNDGVRFHFGHRWIGFDANGLFQVENSNGQFTIKPDVVVLALGGASWPQLGSTGEWTSWLRQRRVQIVDWQSANCGFEVSWTDLLKQKFDGAPLKTVSLTFTGLNGITETRQGELLIKEWGIEGGLIYSFSKQLREVITARGEATFYIDLVPDRSAARVLKELSRPRGSRTLSRHMRTCIGDDVLKRTLLYEVVDRKILDDPKALAKAIKALPIIVRSTRPIAEAISSAGGISFDSLDDNLMLKVLPGVFVAGEMIDWEAPTGGYLLTACFATGRWAGLNAAQWLKTNTTAN